MRRKIWLLFSLVLALSLTLYSCGGGGGSSSGSSSSGGSTSPSTKTVSYTASLSGTSSSSSRSVANAGGKATLTVYLNGDNTTYTATLDNNGSFSFNNIAVSPDNSTTKALLKISKEGYAPYEKVIYLPKNGSTRITYSLVPAQTITQKIDNTTDNITIKGNSGGYLEIGLNKSGKPFIKETNSRDVNNNDSKISVSIPISDIPTSVHSITASLAAFNGSDVKHFPGQFQGTGYPGSRASSNFVSLKSISYAYINLTDQNGKKIELIDNTSKETGKPGMTVTFNIPCDQLTNIKDDNNTDSGVQVPLWTYNYNTSSWTWVGEGSLYYDNGTPVDNATNLTCDNHTYYVKGTIEVANWGNWVNIDYPIITNPSELKSVCVKLVDQNNNPISGAYVYGEGDTYVDGTTDDNGTVKFEGLINDNYTFYVDYAPFGLYSYEINVNIDNNSQCQTRKLNNPLNATLTVKLLKNNSQMKGKWVEVYSDNGYWNGKYTDDKGTATFKVKSGETYTINAIGQTYNVTLSSDNLTVTRTITYKNTPPVVSSYIWPTTVKPGQSITAYVYASDYDGDALKLTKATYGLSNINCVQTYGVIYKDDNGNPISSYYNWECSIDNLTQSGTFKATVSDGNGHSVSTSDNITVTQDRPPQVYGIDIMDNGTYVYNWNALKKGETYTLTAYAWDPDGDNLTYTFYLDNDSVPICNASDNNTCQYTFQKDGNHNIKVEVNDKFNKPVEYTISVHVGAAKPVIYSVGADKYLLNPYGDTINVFAYASAPGANLTTDNFVWSVDGDNVTVDNANYSDGEYTGSITLTFDNQSKATHTIKLTVTNGDQKTSSSFTVWTDRPPIFKTSLSDNVTLNQGDVYTFEVNAEDPDFQTVKYSWRINCNNAGWVDAGSNDSTLTYEFDDNGTCEVQAIASDGILQTTSTCKVYVKASAATPDVGQAMYKFIVNPNDDNYNTLLSTINQLPESKTAHLWRAIGELLKFYQDNQDTLNNKLDFSMDDIDKHYYGLIVAYNLLTQSNYGQETEGLIKSAEDVLDNAYNELQQAEGINTAITVGPDTVYFDTLDIKIMELIDRIAKATCLYSSLVNIDDVQNWKVHTSATTEADIRNLIKERNVTTEEWAEFFKNNPDILKYSDTAKLSDFENAVSDIEELYNNIMDKFNSLTEEQLYQRHNHAFGLASEAELKYADAFKTTLSDIVKAMSDASQNIEVPHEYFKGEVSVIDGGNGYYYPVELYSLYMDTYSPSDNLTIYNLISGNVTPRDLLASAFNPQSEEPYVYKSQKLLFDNLTHPRWNAPIPEYKLPTADINVKDNSSSDWDNVPAFFQKDNLTIKIATDGTNFYVYAEGPKDVIDNLQYYESINFGFNPWPDEIANDKYSDYELQFSITSEGVEVYPGPSIYKDVSYETLDNGNTLGIEVSCPLNYVTLKDRANFFWIDTDFWWANKLYKFLH